MMTRRSSRTRTTRRMISGKVDLGRAPSVGGTYTDVEPMGLFWSMKPSSEMRRGVRLIKAKVEEPFEYEIFLLDGHLTVSSRQDLTSSGSPLANIKLHRFYQSPDVTAIPIRSGSIRGTLFLPREGGSYPGVIDMFGAAGGSIKTRAALLASRGFATLSLSYFGFEDLPKTIDLNLEYFEEAIEFMKSHPSVDQNGLGVVGVCKGANLAMEMALLSSHVKAVVAINPYFYHDTGTLKRGGIEQNVWNPWYLIPKTTSRRNLVWLQRTEIFPTGNLSSIAWWTTKMMLPFQSRGPKQPSICSLSVRMIMNTDPMNTGFIARRMERFGKTNYQVLSYPGAGHLIEPPYTPLCSESYFKHFNLMFRFGGQPKPHSFAQENSWQNILSFLHRNISSSHNIRKRFFSSTSKAGTRTTHAIDNCASSGEQHVGNAKLGFPRSPWASSVYRILRICSK